MTPTQTLVANAIAYELNLDHADIRPHIERAAARAIAIVKETAATPTQEQILKDALEIIATDEKTYIGHGDYYEGPFSGEYCQRVARKALTAAGVDQKSDRRPSDRKVAKNAGGNCPGPLTAPTFGPFDQKNMTFQDILLPNGIKLHRSDYDFNTWHDQHGKIYKVTGKLDDQSIIVSSDEGTWTITLT